MVKYFDFWVNFIQRSITICLDNASGIGHGRRWRALSGGFMGDQFIAEAEWHRSWHWCHQKHSPGHDHWLMLAVNTMLPKVKYTEYAVPQYLFKSLTCFWIVFMAAFPWKVYQLWWFESYLSAKMRELLQCSLILKLVRIWWTNAIPCFPGMELSQLSTIAALEKLGNIVRKILRPDNARRQGRVTL